ncbi:MAG: glycosyltransferase family 2 protein [Bacteroidales bacterium]
MHPFGISVIICVYNGAKRIIPTLKALSEQHLPHGIPFELLIIDNASTDDTTSVANEYWNAVNAPFPLKIISEPRPGKANALTTGYNEANYELMLLCDDDNWLQPDYFNIVIELYNLHPDIGLMGGYGKAFFEPNEKPHWFDKWENYYACGKHHKNNGFLGENNYRIWGAGSVIRKTLWDFLVSNGFKFKNSTTGGKAMTEDAELSLAVIFTGHRLYFDERLWFIHDLHGGRINWDNLIEQQKLNGKNNAILNMYILASDLISNSLSSFSFLYAIQMLKLLIHLIWSFLKWNFRPEWLFYYNNLKELILHPRKYKNISNSSSIWIRNIKSSLPLSVEINKNFN